MLLFQFEGSEGSLAQAAGRGRPWVCPRVDKLNGAVENGS